MKSTRTTPTSKQPTSTTRQDDLELARDLSEAGDIDGAYVVANKYLKEDPNDVKFLTVFVHLLLQGKKEVITYQLAKRCTELAPRHAPMWTNYGMACQDLWQSKEAERAYKRGLKYARNDEERHLLLVNLAAVLIDTGRFTEAEPYALESVKLEPDSQKGLSNLGFCQLAQRNWAEGWKNYRNCIGTDWRPRHNYGGEPEWDGTPGKKVVLYTEQGIGDVLSFASMLPDVAEDAKVILEVEPRLKGLMSRSFPQVKVYGTAGKKELKWAPEDMQIDYSLPIGQCAEYYRREDSDFPGTPYLVPDPDRVLMWKTLFKSKKKPVIGLGWSSGVPKTGSRFRQWDLEQLLPILRSVDAHWVSLQYRPAGDEIAAFKEQYPDIDIVEYPTATLTRDYDDTAAMVASLDMVMCIHTAAGHLAGGLGVPAWVFVPQNSQWRYGEGVEDMIWYDSMRLIRQTKRGEWGDDINRVAKELHAHFSRVPKAAGKTSRKGELRNNSGQVRANGLSDNRQSGDRAPA